MYWATFLSRLCDSVQWWRFCRTPTGVYSLQWKKEMSMIHLKYVVVHTTIAAGSMVCYGGTWESADPHGKGPEVSWERGQTWDLKDR